MFSLFGYSQPPVVEVEPPPSLVSVAGEYIQKPIGFQNMVIRPALRVLKWADFVGALSHAGKECKALLGSINQTFFWLDFPGDLKKLADAITQLKDKIFTGSYWDVSVCSKNVFIRTAFVTDLIAEGLQIVHERNFIQFSASQLAILSTVGFLGSTALVISAFSGLQTQFDRFINAEIGSPEFKHSLIRMAAKTCLLAVGIFGMVSFVIGPIIPAFVLLIVSTLLLLFSLMGYFYDKLYLSVQEKTVDL